MNDVHPNLCNGMMQICASRILKDFFLNNRKSNCAILANSEFTSALSRNEPQMDYESFYDLNMKMSNLYSTNLDMKMIYFRAFFVDLQPDRTSTNNRSCTVCKFWHFVIARIPNIKIDVLKAFFFLGISTYH